jgi:hypothetical protein
MGMIDIEREFWRAISTAKKSGIDFPFSRRIQWGVALVQFYGNDRRRYEPQPDGEWAFIAPVVEGGDLIDLCAIDGRNGHWATRQGFGHGLGIDAIENARWGTNDLWVMATALEWLHQPVDAVYLFDLTKAEVVFDGVREITCRSRVMAERIAANLPPSTRDRVAVGDVDG